MSGHHPWPPPPRYPFPPQSMCRYIVNAKCDHGMNHETLYRDDNNVLKCGDCGKRIECGEPYLMPSGEFGSVLHDHMYNHGFVL